jgi:putative transposase
MSPSIRRARLVERAADWPHSSVRAHPAARDDGLVAVRPLLDQAPNFANCLDTGPDDPGFAALRGFAARADRPPAWRPRLSGRDQPPPRPHPHAGQTRAETETRGSDR